MGDIARLAVARQPARPGRFPSKNAYIIIPFPVPRIFLANSSSR